ncbi:MAG TPA: hypothetical protein VMT34_17815 [Aggregatilineales bacterium]|nr:hypothetical protein [Aggregatilineales bacterium]
MNQQVRWLRLCYWIGAIIDALATVPLIFPGLAASLYRWTSFTPGPELRSVSGVGASLMLGWTALLLWADRKPIERKGVLVLTVFPVLVTMLINRVIDVSQGVISFQDALPFGILQVVLVVLLTFSYLQAGSAEIAPRRA